MHESMAGELHLAGPARSRLPDVPSLDGPDPDVPLGTFEPDFTEDLDRVRREGERFREAMNGDSELAVFARSLREGRI